MDTPQEYLEKTRSSVEHIFSGIKAYVDVLRESALPVFAVDPKLDAATAATAFEAWLQQNAPLFERRLESEKRYFSQAFAQANLCGALLQVAHMAITLYGNAVPAPVRLDHRELSDDHRKFYVGRKVRTLPMGLLILAGRNQYMHFDDPDLRYPSVAIFDVLATHSDRGPFRARDPAFDLRNQRRPLCFSSNITGLLGWRSYAPYESDMRALLGMGG